MGKETIRPEDLGRIFFKFFKDDMEQVFPSIIENIENINETNDDKINLDVNKTYDELIFLHVFAYHQEISNHFESHIQIFSEKFHDEFENYLKKSMSEEDIVNFFINLNIILLEYFKQYDEIIRNENEKAVLIKFGSYIARRILGEKYENDPYYSYYFSICYGTIRKGLIELIQSSIVNVESE